MNSLITWAENSTTLVGKSQLDPASLEEQLPLIVAADFAGRLFYCLTPEILKSIGELKLMKRHSLALVLAALLVGGSVAAQDLNSEKGKLSYYFGYELGGNLAELTARGEQLDTDTVVKGLRDALARSQPAITTEQLRPALEAFQTREQGRAETARAEYERVAAENSAKSTQFLATNGSRAGVKTLPGGVQYKVIQAGSGAKPTLNSTVALEVSGPFPYGERPEQARPPQKVDAIKLGEVEMDAIRQTLLQMPSGAKWEITLPPERAYGADPRTPFPPSVAVQFEIKLVSVR